MKSVVYKRRIQEEYRKSYQSSTKSIEMPQYVKDDKLFSSYGCEISEYEEMGKHTGSFF